MQYFCTDILSLGLSSQEETLFASSISGLLFLSLGEVHHTFVASKSSCYTWRPSQEAPHSDWVFFTHTQKFTLRAVWFYELWLTHEVRCPSHCYYREYCRAFLTRSALCYQALPWSLTTTTWLLHPCFCLFIKPCNWHHLICGLWTGLLSLNKRHLNHPCGCEDQSTEQYYCPLLEDAKVHDYISMRKDICAASSSWWLLIKLCYRHHLICFCVNTFFFIHLNKFLGAVWFLP